MENEARKVAWTDLLRLQLYLTIPTFLLGLVAPNRFFLWLFVKCGVAKRTARFLRDLRDKYGCDHLWVRFPLRRTLLVMAPATMDAVLASSDNAPDPFLKRRAVSRFVPGALVISNTIEARDRRDFNTRALDLGTNRPHRHSEAFVAIAVAETARLAADRAAGLRWSDFQSLGQRISHQVILGMGQSEPALAKHLSRMVTLSNVLLRYVPSFSAFYQRMQQLLTRQETAAAASCLMHDAAKSLADGDAGEATKVPSQIGFWFFVLKDAIELHVARTLALIAAHPEVEARLREEMRAAGPLTATSIDNLRYLEACIAEQLRLWTPVPMLLRRAEKAFLLRTGIPIGAEEQILIHAGAYHRDPRVFGDVADTFSPDASRRDGFPGVYFFSADRRGCAGRSLVMFVLKATLASLLAASRFELVGPAVQPGRIGYAYDHFAIELRPIP